MSTPSVWTARLRRPLGELRRGSIHAYRRATASGRILPTAIIIGAQKGGTSSLHEYLADHPDVARPTVKEIHYFSDNRYRPLSWYAAFFPRTGAYEHAVESTPYYLFHPSAPRQIHAALPDVKLIALLRDPVERAYSQYQMISSHFGYETLDFAGAVRAEDDRLRGEEQRMLEDPRYNSFAHKHFSYVARGMYARQLERWYRYFAPEQILVLPSEDLFSDPGGTLHRVQRWLGLPEHTPADLSPQNTRAYSSMDPAVRAELQARFAPDVARLRELTGGEFPWTC